MHVFKGKITNFYMKIFGNSTRQVSFRQISLIAPAAARVPHGTLCPVKLRAHDKYPQTELYREWRTTSARTPAPRVYRKVRINPR